ncbi:MAG TPA: lytic transglycosylase domain-containing protein [Chitinophagaceae bacterium]|nr:lytic transglycosylase domain-containing protein [Chitinophagaceae bacterium]
MKRRLLFIFMFVSFNVNAHVITFCGEVVPVDKDFVSTKLMNTIKNNINLVKMADMRARVNAYFPIFDMYFKKWGVPADFKYLAIVESTLKPLTSRVGAQGYWQIMPATAKELGLNIGGVNGDERNDLHKSTEAAARLLVNYYKQLKKLVGVYSWILTAASYNCGPGCVQKRVKAEGETNYFDLDLNKETAAYVYRIIAIKELFEYPEIYMKNFGYNIFNKANAGRKLSLDAPDTDFAKYSNIKLKKKKKQAPIDEAPTFTEKLISAHIKGKYKNFQDGDLVTIQIEEPFEMDGAFKAKGSTISGTGWMIDDKIYVDLGYGPDVMFCDAGGVKGINPSDLGKDRPVLIKAKLWN